MFNISNFTQLQNIIEELGRIAADEGRYSTSFYKRSSGSHTRIKGRYKNQLFSIEYPSFYKGKRVLLNVYVNTRTKVLIE